MPFPLAHPAAVLPLRRWSPRFLSFPGLVVGSLIPDAGYCFSALRVESFSHHVLGTVGFCLPLGMLVLVLLYAFRGRFLLRLPAPYQRVFLAEHWRPLGSPISVAVSIVLGALTHVFLDGFAHRDGWFVQQFALLRTPVATFAGRNIRPCHLLWYAFSFAGIVWLVWAYQRWQTDCHPAETLGSPQARLRDALIAAVLVLPLELAHHLVGGLLGMILVLIGTLSLFAVVVFRIGRRAATSP